MLGLLLVQVLFFFRVKAWPVLVALSPHMALHREPRGRDNCWGFAEGDKVNLVLEYNQHLRPSNKSPKHQKLVLKLFVGSLGYAEFSASLKSIQRFRLEYLDLI